MGQLGRNSTTLELVEPETRTKSRYEHCHPMVNSSKPDSNRKRVKGLATPTLDTLEKTAVVQWMRDNIYYVTINYKMNN